MSELTERLRRKHENWALGQKGPPILLEAAVEIERLRSAATLALAEMCNTVAPRDSFTDAVDALDAALYPKPS